MRRLNLCAGQVDGGRRSGGGARWMRRATCPVCGKTLRLTREGRLRPHGTVATPTATTVAIVRPAAPQEAR